jgi:hypothetical protein
MSFQTAGISLNDSNSWELVELLWDRIYPDWAHPAAAKPSGLRGLIFAVHEFIFPLVTLSIWSSEDPTHTTWHLDEDYLKINGQMVYLWCANGWRLNLAVQWREVFERSKMFENGGAVTPSVSETRNLGIKEPQMYRLASNVSCHS